MDETQIQRCLQDLQQIAPAGFAIALHIRFTTPTYLFQTYPKVWIDHYSRAGLVMQDPTVHWGFSNTGSITWTALASDDPADVIGQAADHGLRFGLTYATNASETLSVTSFAHADRDFDDHEAAKLQAGVDALHAATKSLTKLSDETIASLRGSGINTTLS